MLIYLLLFIIVVICAISCFFISQKKIEGGRPIDKNIHFEPLYSRLLNKGPKEKFFGRHIREMISLKLGQRKLLFNELEFYMLCFTHIFEKKGQKGGGGEEKKKITVIYPGSAAGIHSVFLIKEFSNIADQNSLNIMFHFYDINPFAEELKTLPNLKIYNQLFADEDALSFVQSTNEKYVIFLSDIRSGADEDAVDFDMELQRNWVNIIKPDACMLKFRLPWRDGRTKYFDGDIYTQPRIGPSSTETRLISFSPAIAGEKEYDNESYNNRIFYWQRHQRNAFHEIENFEELSKSIKGLCHCYDCWSEIEICKIYIEFKKKYAPSSVLCAKEEEIIKLMNEIDAASKSSLNIAPHNLFVNMRDINKKISLLEKNTHKYFEGVVDKFNENMAK